ncbi:hypothetical protein ACFXD5_40600 [Streptomyces sp. NPDC059385]|uniref:hypothetical protein n=1 Tax=Streptomyces sp. NPDC059385 TaxID=3346817 RepID=UPI00368641BE
MHRSKPSRARMLVPSALAVVILTGAAAPAGAADGQGAAEIARRSAAVQRQIEEVEEQVAAAGPIDDLLSGLTKTIGDLLNSLGGLLGVKLPPIELPKLPEIKLPEIKLPEVKLPELPVEVPKLPVELPPVDTAVPELPATPLKPPAELVPELPDIPDVPDLPKVRGAGKAAWSPSHDYDD